MKPFNLEAAKVGAQVITRDKRKARIVCFDRKIILNDYPILTLITDKDGYETCASNRLDGSGPFPLFMAPVKVERWINVYPDDDEACLHKSEKIADEKASEHRIACIKIEYEV